MPTYEIGDYKAKTTYNKGGFFDFPRWILTIYYKDSWIKTEDYHSTETRALESAKYEINAHKTALKNLTNV